MSTPELRAVAVGAADSEGLRRDVRRIASTVFCGAGIDRSILTFAVRRTAAYWGRTEESVDVLVTARLLAKTGRLIGDLQWLEADRSAPGQTLS